MIQFQLVHVQTDQGAADLLSIVVDITAIDIVILVCQGKETALFQTKAVTAACSAGGNLPVQVSQVILREQGRPMDELVHEGHIIDTSV